MMEGAEFRHLVRHSATAFGVEKLASFQGAYTAPDKGFDVTGVQHDNPLLAQDYLAAAMADPSAVPEGLRRFLKPEAEDAPADDRVQLTPDGFVVTAADG